jgi:hypothetical protein
MSRQRLFQILWAAEFVVGLSPAVLLVIIGLPSYLVALPAVLIGCFSGELAVVRTAIVLNGTMIGAC